MAEAFKFPTIRACIFDVDGLLINSEDIYSEIYNIILHEYGAPDYPWRIKATQQSRGKSGNQRILKWANIPITVDEWKAKEKSHLHLFSKSKILPGVADLLETLTTKISPPISIALASSADRGIFNLKTSHIPELQGKFPEECRVFGYDPKMAGRERKPAPDIFLFAKETLDKVLKEKGERELDPLECLVFEDSIAGVEAGRRAGMRVIWVPLPGLAKVTKGREQEVLMGITEREGTPVFEDEGEVSNISLSDRVVSEDGIVQKLPSLEAFPYAEYGLKVVD